MVGASKILTVSYGTFSCTLEGFDEPFNTMKAIAEYFRDLAADDRYFGAEPPTPDAAMLHQIAEREMKRRVEAKIQDNGVILRASDSSDGLEPAVQPTRTGQTAARALLSGQPTAKPATDPMFEDQHAAAPVASAARSADTGISDSVAAKLSRIRGAMAESRASGETTRPSINVAAGLAAEAAATAAADAAVAKAETDALAKAEQAKADLESAAQADAKAKAEAAKKAEAEAQQKADALAKSEAEARAKAEAVAKAEAEAEATEKLAADLAAKAEAEARATAEAEAAKAEAEAQNTTSSDDALLASLAGAFDDEDFSVSERFDDDAADADNAPTADADNAPTADADNAPTADAEGDDTLMASLAIAMSDAPPAKSDDTKTADNSQLAELDNDLDDDFSEKDLADLAVLDGAAIEAPKAEAAPIATSFGEGFAATDGLPTTLDVTPSEKVTNADTAAETPAVPVAAEVNPTLQRARARVIKIRRAPAAEQAALDAAKPASSETSALSPEAEADLMRELADLQSDRSTTDKPTRDDGNTDATVAPVRPQRPVSTRRRASELSSSEDDASVKRLLDQTNSELQGTENRRRLSAISHLKAAVAATVADRKSGGDQGPTEEMRMNPYRVDLERAVRPRTSTAAAPALSGDRPAPLMLVSEQRIDTPRAKPDAGQTHIAPVRPRRVSGSNLALTTDDDEDDQDLDAALNDSDARNVFGATTSFADFAEKLGAESLVDLLEAAVAYSSHVEGHPEVSRPQILRHVLTIQPDLQEDRETMLRGFGALLRSGRIEKVRKGQFILSEESTMLAEARKAAQG